MDLTGDGRIFEVREVRASPVMPDCLIMYVCMTWYRFPWLIAGLRRETTGNAVVMGVVGMPPAVLTFQTKTYIKTTPVRSIQEIMMEGIPSQRAQSKKS